MTQTLDLRARVFESLDNAAVNGYDMAVLCSGEVASDLIDRDADVEAANAAGVEFKTIVELVDAWKESRRDKV